MALNPVAKKWVAALRSGKYKQAHNKLGSGYDQRCCLGVLCDLAVESGIIQGYSLWDVFLPVQVQEWAGLSTERASYGSLSTNALWKDNDGVTPDSGVANSKFEKPFSEIATIIESEPEGLFKK